MAEISPRGDDTHAQEVASCFADNNDSYDLTGTLLANMRLRQKMKPRCRRNRDYRVAPNVCFARQQGQSLTS